jgi:predicted ATPase
MALLQAAVTGLKQGQGGVVSVIGEAGIGKSKLIKELYRLDTEAKDEDTKWAVGRAVSYGQNVSYLVARDLLRHFLGLGLETSPSDVASALQTELEAFSPEDQTELYPYLAHLLEIPGEGEAAQRLKYLSGEALHREILQAVQRFLMAGAKRQPLVLVWEDLHWADPSSLSLLESLIPLTQESRLLLVLIFRPRFGSRIWVLHGNLSHTLGATYLSFELPPLSYKESEQLLKNLLGDCGLPEKTYQIILTKAEGNPFYLEEVIRTLIESGGITQTADGRGWTVTTNIDNIPIPNNLQGVIMARIDRLNPDLKRTLQVASVIGRNFSYRVLARVMGQE